jgi:hypothetical protein
MLRRGGTLAEEKGIQCLAPLVTAFASLD